MASLESLIRYSKSILRQVANSDTPLIINFSGGKDSLACLVLALEVTDNVECLFMDSGQELPNTLDYVRKRCKEFGVKLHVSHPLRDRIKHRTIPDHVRLLPDYVRWWGYFPTKVRRYCNIWLKVRPARVYCRKVWGRQTLYKVVGVRLDESNTRMYRYRGKGCIVPDPEHSGSYLVYPILHWTKEDVLKFLKMRGVELHEGYKLFGMSGCKWCPVAKPWQIRAIARVYPHIYDDLVEAERDINKPAWLHENIWLRDLVRE